MAIIYELCASDFSNLFDQYNRSENFTHIARDALFDYLEELSYVIGEPVNVDILELCCNWSEYTEEEIVQHYGHSLGAEDIEALVIELQNKTSVIELHNGCYLVQDV